MEIRIKDKHSPAFHTLYYHALDSDQVIDFLCQFDSALGPRSKPRNKSELRTNATAAGALNLEQRENCQHRLHEHAMCAPPWPTALTVERPVLLKQSEVIVTLYSSAKNKEIRFKDQHNFRVSYSLYGEQVKSILDSDTGSFLRRLDCALGPRSKGRTKSELEGNVMTVAVGGS